MNGNHPHRVARRSVLTGLLGVAGATTLLAACAPATAPSPTTAPAKPAESKPADAKPAAQAPPSAPTETAKPAAQAPAAGGAARTFTFRLSSALPNSPDSELFPFSDRFTKSLADKVGDQVRIDFFPSNQLGEEAAIVQQIKLGSVEMMTSGSPIWATAVPQFATFDLGYIFNDFDHMARSFDGQPGKAIEKLMEDAGARILGWGIGYGWRSVIASKPVEKVDDLRGLKIRVIQNPNYVATVNAMGAVATPMAFGEVYTSLQSGVIDGLEHNAPTILSNKFHEVVKNFTLTQHIGVPTLLVISQAKFMELPADVQQAFVEAGQDAAREARQLAVSTDDSAKKRLQEAGVTIRDIDREALRARVKPVWDQWTQRQSGTKDLLDQIQAL